MIKTALLCSGQGSQYVGMIKELSERYSVISELSKQADAILGYPLMQICYDGPADKLKETRYTQPALFVHSVAVYELLKDKISIEAVAGHSVGEYAALYISGVLNFEDALNLVSLRGQLMFAAGAEIAGTMFAVIGLSDDKIKTLCDTLTDASEDLYVVPANYNSPGQVVISGSADYLKQNIGKFKEAGAKMCKELQVSGAFHSPLMLPAQQNLEKAINSIEFKDATIPVYSNVTALPVKNGEILRQLLIKQLTSPVNWTESINNMYSDGIRKYIEIGAGNVLQGLVKRIISAMDIEITGYDKVDDFE